MTTYRSTTTYQLMLDVPENVDFLKDWGYVSPMGPTGLYVVYDNKNHMVSAIVSADDFAIQFEQIPDPVQPS